MHVSGSASIHPAREPDAERLPPVLQEEHGGQVGHAARHRREVYVDPVDPSLFGPELGLKSPLCLVIPDFPVSCRRLTPGPGYLETLLMDHVSADNIQHISLHALTRLVA